ncbi:hypothetical protein CENSYa_0921 [Cenarchaeum symbiosum A]|uniref:Uncharacterized protein n=1 Tax=Cenarchaeum symbiosum (strain A) TaxID=414004 RepID=A0RW36_CENSY|nr:hypothetical protein CENSYa_0921 [Cenarchaeum symbiosum A]
MPLEARRALAFFLHYMRLGRASSESKMVRAAFLSWNPTHHGPALYALCGRTCCTSESCATRSDSLVPLSRSYPVCPEIPCSCRPAIAPWRSRHRPAAYIQPIRPLWDLP